MLNDCDDLIAAILLLGGVLVRSHGCGGRTCRGLDSWLRSCGGVGLCDEIRRHIESDGTIACTILKCCNFGRLLLLSFLITPRCSRFLPLLIGSFRRVYHDQISTCRRWVTIVAGRVAAHIATAIFRGSGGL